jgi:dihydrodipicolinate synthase/N-acetylneuraminate lyase
VSGLKLEGVNASVPLPLTDDFRPDYAEFRRYLDWLRRQGVGAITVNADTGEGAHLDRDELLAVVECAREAVGDELGVVSGLVASHTAQAVGLARDLAEAGADALLVFSPPAFTGDPLPEELVLGYFAALGEVGLPLVAFNLTPRLGGTVLSPSTLGRLADEGLIAALKEASFDPPAYIASRDAVRSAGGGVALLTGCDNFIFESLLLGADGCLLGFASLAAAETVRLVELVAARRLDEAEGFDRRCIAPLAAAMFAPPMRDSRARIKYGLRLLGVMDGGVVRPPLLGLGAEQERAMRDAMETSGLLAGHEAVPS